MCFMTILSTLDFASAPREMRGHFLAIVVKLLYAKVIAATPERLVDERAASLDLLAAVVRRDVEVEDRFPAPACADPARGEARDGRRALHHVAHHPVEGLRGAKVEAVVAPMLHLPGLEQALVDRAVVHGDHRDLTLPQLPGPSSWGRAQVGRGHAGREAARALALRNELHDRLGELQGGTRGRARGHAQPHDAHRPGGAVRHGGDADVRRGRADEEHVKALVRLLVEGDAGARQALFEMRPQRARERRKRFAVVRIRHLEGELGEALPQGGCDADNGSCPVARGKALQQLADAHQLAWKHEAAKLDALPELRAQRLLVRLEVRETALGTRLHESRDARVERDRGELLRALALEAGAAVANDVRRIHRGRAWRKREKKFSVVAAAIVSKAIPRRRAISSATWRTNAGWFVLPRCGTGAR